MSAPEDPEDLLAELITLLVDACLKSRAEAGTRRTARLRGRKRRPRPASAAIARKEGCGTLLAWLLHRSLGERPCRLCVHAAAARWAQQAVRELRRAV